MAKRVSAQDPALAIEFFLSGFYTHRSQLFAPFKGIGVNVVQFKDPVIDGQQMELTDLYEWSRRPGFSIFCSVPLSSSEIVNQFYSTRNLDGEVISFFDSTARLATFTSNSITTLFAKTIPNQGYVTSIGNMSYYSDGNGADMQKWDSVAPLSAGINPSPMGLAAPTNTPTMQNLGCWLKLSHYATNIPILDPNGCVQVAFSTATGTISSVGSFSAFAPIVLAGSNGGAYLPKGNGAGILYQQVKMSTNTYANYTGWMGFGFNIPAGATILGLQASISKDQVSSASTGAVTTDQSVKLLVAGAPSGTDHASATPWEVIVLGGMPSGGRTATYGSPTDMWGLSLTPAIVNASGFGVAIAPKETGGYAGGDWAEIDQTPFPVTIEVFYQVPAGAGGSGQSGENEPTWSTTLGSVTYDGTVIWTNYGPVLTWMPVTNFLLPAVVLDSNGNLQLAVVATSPILAYNPSTPYTIGQAVQFGGLYWIALAGSTGVTPSAAYSTSTIAGGVTTTVIYWAQTLSPITSGATVPTWNTAIGGTTSDGNYTWTNMGPGTLIETVGTSYVYGFRTIYGHLTTCSPISLSTGSIFGSQSAGITAFVISGGVVAFTGNNNFVAGSTYTVSGLSTPAGEVLNGQTFVVLAAGLSLTSFSSNTTAASVGATSDTGTTVPLIATVSGIGTFSPLCNATATITAVGAIASVVRITAVNNLFPGNYVTFTGLTNATWLNNQQAQVINVDPNGAFFEVYILTPNYQTLADTGTATFNAVEIYRVSDGGGIYLLAGAVTNPGGNVPWRYDDFTTDINLNILQIAPQYNQNDPPPGAPGSTVNTAGTITAYWQGRLWMVVDNFVYFDAGPDCTNGISQESWPPGNRFQFAGAPLALVPTADGVGMLVVLADRVNAILGGPETISFYATDFLGNFGISDPNAIWRDGSTIGLFTTQRQYFELLGAQKQEIGEHVSDYLAKNFVAANTYATMHRDGLDVGMFLSNGVDRVLRYGSNITAWSVPSFPACGAGALRSIETSVGITTLMLASPAGGAGNSSGRINPTSGVSVAGTGTAWATPSNITLGTLTQYATVTFAAPGSSQVLRASAYAPLAVPTGAVISGIQIAIVGKQSFPTGLTLTVKPTNAPVGAESHTFAFGATNTSEVFGTVFDLWGMPWGDPANAGTIGFDIVATRV
jgi:hypothetical protein